MTAAALRKTAATARAAQQRAADAAHKRDTAIREAIAAGFTHAAIAKATGLTRGRINQISKGTR